MTSKYISGVLVSTRSLAACHPGEAVALWASTREFRPTASVIPCRGQGALWVHESPSAPRRRLSIALSAPVQPIDSRPDMEADARFVGSHGPEAAPTTTWLNEPVRLVRTSHSSPATAAQRREWRSLRQRTTDEQRLHLERPALPPSTLGHAVSELERGISGAWLPGHGAVGDNDPFETRELSPHPTSSRDAPVYRINFVL